MNLCLHNGNIQLRSVKLLTKFKKLTSMTFEVKHLNIKNLRLCKVSIYTKSDQISYKKDI